MDKHEIQNLWGQAQDQGVSGIAPSIWFANAIIARMAESAAPSDEAALLATGIRDVAVRLGIIQQATPLTGPQCLALLENIRAMAANDQPQADEGDFSSYTRTDLLGYIEVLRSGSDNCQIIYQAQYHQKHPHAWVDCTKTQYDIYVQHGEGKIPVRILYQ